MRDRVIITGITGFVGSNLYNFTKFNFEVIGISRTLKSNYATYNNLESLFENKSKAVIHLAAKNQDLRSESKEDEAEYFEVNTKLTKDVFDLFLKSDSEVFIFISSVKAVADTFENVLKENEIPNPKTAYGKSKLAAEQYILSKDLKKNKRLYILRPCMIHGPNNKGNLFFLYEIIKKGIPYPLGSFKNKRSFLSVENLCFIINELIINNTIDSGVYNISDSDSISTNKLISVISKTVNKPVKILKLGKNFIRLVAFFGDFVPIPFNSEKLKKLTSNYVVSNEKILKAISENLPLDIISGLQKTIKSFD